MTIKNIIGLIHCQNLQTFDKTNTRTKLFISSNMTTDICETIEYIYTQYYYAQLTYTGPNVICFFDNAFELPESINIRAIKISMI